VIDSNREEIAVHEARKLGIPVIAIVDTNCDPGMVDYIIPGNDDALRAIKLFTSRLADAIIEGRQMRESLSSDGNGDAADSDDVESASANVEEGAKPIQEASSPA
jgi:small subunit ribosomal protein S2